MTEPAVAPDFDAPFYRRRRDIDDTWWGGFVMVEVEPPAPSEDLVYLGTEERGDGTWRWWRGWFGDGGTAPALRWAQRVMPASAGEEAA